MHRIIIWRRWLLVFACLYSGSLQGSTTLYRELYSGPQQDPCDVGWHVHVMPVGNPGKAGTSGTGAGGDADTMGPSLQSHPTASDDNLAYMYLGQPGFLFWTDEYILDRDVWTDLTFTWSYAHDGQLVNPMRIAVKIGNEWFVSDPPVDITGCCWAPSYRTTVSLAEVHWRELFFEQGVILELGESVPFIPGDNIVAFGLFADFSNGNKRVDSFTVAGKQAGPRLLVQVDPAHVTSVHPGPTMHDCSWGSVVTLHAWDYLDCPDVYRFDHWTGDVAEPYQAQTTITMYTNEIVKAVFTPTSQCGDECHPHPVEDLTRDCRVDLFDFSVFIEEWLGFHR